MRMEVGRRKRNQPAPPWAVYEALVDPDRDPCRQWLRLLVDEQPPRVIEAARPHLVVWSSLWSHRPDAIIRFDLLGEGVSGTDLIWSLSVEEPEPELPQLGHFRKRINELINAELRYSFGQ